MTHPAALQALSTGPDNRPFSPTRQHGNETQGFFSRLLGTYCVINEICWQQGHRCSERTSALAMMI